LEIIEAVVDDAPFSIDRAGTVFLRPRRWLFLENGSNRHARWLASKHGQYKSRKNTPTTEVEDEGKDHGRHGNRQSPMSFGLRPRRSVQSP